MQKNVNKKRILSLTNVSKYGLLPVLGTAVLTSNANAAFSIEAALAGNTTSDNIEAAGTFVLGVAVLYWGIRKAIAFFGR